MEAAEPVDTKTNYELLQQMVEGTGNDETLYTDRLAALAELNNRLDQIRTAGHDTEEFAIYRIRGALACYDLKESPPDELRVVVKWAVNRFHLNLIPWFDEEADLPDDHRELWQDEGGGG